MFINFKKIQSYREGHVLLKPGVIFVAEGHAHPAIKLIPFCTLLHGKLFTFYVCSSANNLESRSRRWYKGVKKYAYCNGIWHFLLRKDMSDGTNMEHVCLFIQTLLKRCQVFDKCIFPTSYGNKLLSNGNVNDEKIMGLLSVFVYGALLWIKYVLKVFIQNIYIYW